MVVVLHVGKVNIFDCENIEIPKVIILQYIEKDEKTKGAIKMSKLEQLFNKKINNFQDTKSIRSFFTRVDISMIFLLFVVGVFLLWKCKFGFSNIDESFYLTIPYRLCKGDALFVDEWHLSQLSGILIMPFMKLYLLLHETTEGMCLWFRYLYTFLQIISSAFIYYRLRNFK